MMEKDDVFRIVNNPNLIPGIYNYCDRWCERCAFTQRCANFSIHEKHFKDLGAHDLQSKQFWAELSKIFKLTLAMIEDLANQHDIDLDSIDDAAFRKRENKIEEEADHFESVQLSEKYLLIAKDWFESSQHVFDEKVEELNQNAGLDLPDLNVEEEVSHLHELTEVIQWYQYQIHVKLRRAVTGQLDEQYEGRNDSPKDSDGSAKVALIGIDRSISAWAKLLSIFPDHEDEFLKILVLLERLRRKTETEFPNARTFIRPGFDER